MGAEGCSASATPIWGPKADRQALRRSRGLDSLAPLCYEYFVLSPKFLGTCYWCAIKIFVLFFAISAGRRKSQKTKPGPAPTGSASANCMQAQNVENTRRFGFFFFFESNYCRPAGRPGERDAYMGAEGCAASARAFQGVRFHWPHYVMNILSLVPSF